MTIEDKAKELYNMIEGDLVRIDNARDPFIVKVVDGFGEVVPLDWVKELIPDLQEAWESFMQGQTFCEHGFYVRDVQKFLHSKYKGKL